MTLVPLLTPDDLPDDVRQLAQDAAAGYGRVLDTWRAIFHRPEIFAAYLPYLRAVAGPGTVDARLKDLTAVLVGWLNQCRYTVGHRSAAARRNNATDAEIVAVVRGDWADFDDPTRTALMFTRQITLWPPTRPYAQDPELLTENVRDGLKEHFRDEQIVELAMNASTWNALSRFHRVMGLELDMPPPPAAIDEYFRAGWFPATGAHSARRQ